MLSSAENFSSLFSWVIGLMYMRWGARLTLAVGGILAAVSWFGLWASLAGLSHPPFEALLFIFTVQGMGSSMADTVVVASVSENFPERRGQAIGVAKSFVGLSAGIFTTVYTGWFGNTDVVGFIFFVGCDFVLAFSAGVWLFRTPPPSYSPDIHDGECSAVDRRFRGALAWVLLLIILILVGPFLSSMAPALDASQGKETVPSPATVLADVLFIVLAFGFVFVSFPVTPCADRVTAADPATRTRADERSAAVPFKPLLQSQSPQDERHVATQTQSKPRPLPPRWSYLSMCCVALVLWGGAIVFLGTGLMLINNLASMFASRTNDASRSSAVFVSLISACNCAGRVVGGYASDVALFRAGLPRPLCLAVACALEAAAMLILVMEGVAPLYAACILGGLAYGAANGLMPVVIAELFPAALLPILYTLIMGTAFAIGSALFSVRLYGATFDAALVRHGLGPTEPCPYHDCFAPSMYAAAAAAMLAAASFVCLALVTRDKYAPYAPSSARAEPSLI